MKCIMCDCEINTLDGEIDPFGDKDNREKVKSKK